MRLILSMLAAVTLAGCVIVPLAPAPPQQGCVIVKGKPVCYQDVVAQGGNPHGCPPGHRFGPFGMFCR